MGDELRQAEAAAEEAVDETPVIIRGEQKFRLLPKIASRPLIAAQREDFEGMFKGVFHPDDVEKAIDEFTVVEVMSIVAESMGVDVPKSSASAG